MTVVVTGAAGFIGFHVCQALLSRGQSVLGIDVINDYYDPALKHARLAVLQRQPGFAFARINIADTDAVDDAFGTAGDITEIVHLAAQAGVRYSLTNPLAYVEANLKGQVVMLEAARRLSSFRHFVYASSSSVYGLSNTLPFSEDDRADQPVSLYGASKRSGELIAHSYGKLYGLPATGLRFFTVYGPWGRPDMAAFLFAEAIVNNRPIRVFNHGDMSRDFTYVDDIVSGVMAATDRPPARSDDPRLVPHRVYNLGNNHPEPLLKMIDWLEELLGRKAEKILEPMQPGDVAATYADISRARRDLGFEPKIPLREGLAHFVAWYRSYRGLPTA